MESAPISFDRTTAFAPVGGSARPRMPRVMDLETIMAARRPVQPTPSPEPVRVAAADNSHRVFPAAPGIAHRPRRAIRSERTSAIARMGVRAAMAACAVAAVVIVPYVLTHIGHSGSAVVQEAQRGKTPTELQTGRSVSEPARTPIRQP